MSSDLVEFDLSAMHRSELEATVVDLAKIIERFRNQLGGIVMDIEDEGDRVYFGSTNDADSLREIERDMLESLNELEMPWTNGVDLFARLREAKDALEARDKELAELRMALHEIDIEAGNTIPPDGKDAAFAALSRITRIINPFRLPRQTKEPTQ